MLYATSILGKVDLIKEVIISLSLTKIKVNNEAVVQKRTSTVVPPSGYNFFLNAQHHKWKAGGKLKRTE